MGDLSVEAMLDELVALREEKAGLEEVIALLEAELEQAWPRTDKGRPEEIAAAGSKWTLKRSSKTTWDHRLVASAVTNWAMMTRQPDADGVMPDPGQAVADAILDCGAVSYWRMKRLEAIGLDPDKYQDKEWGRARPVVVRPAEEED